nr:hypothetical protein [uncultured Holophaga sp.]
MSLPALLTSLLLLADPTTPAVLGASRPGWIEVLPQAPRRLFALGTADLPLGVPEGRALAQASDRARLELIARLKVSVRGETSSTTRTTQAGSGGRSYGYGDRTSRDTVQVLVKADDIPGLAIESTFVDTQARTAYALATLDLDRATEALQVRLGGLEAERRALEPQRTRQARWRLRGLVSELQTLRELSSTLSMEGLQTRTLAEELKASEQLSRLESAQLPPIAPGHCTLGIRSNIQLSPGLEGLLRERVTAAGLKCRDQAPDFRLELRFGGGSQGPALIFAEPRFTGTLVYRLEAELSIVAADGLVLAKAVSISLKQEGSPEGMMEAFLHHLDRRWPMLRDQLMAELGD